MATQNANVNGVIGYFEKRAQAERAIDDLKNAGFRTEQIGLAAHSSDQKGDSVWERIVNFFEGNETQSSKSGTTSRTDPSGYECDYDSKSFRGSLGGVGVSDERARYFEYRLSNDKDGALVTVNAAGRVREAETILERNGADIGAKADRFQYPAPTGLPSPDTRKIQLLGEVLRFTSNKSPEARCEFGRRWYQRIKPSKCLWPVKNSLSNGTPARKERQPVR